MSPIVLHAGLHKTGTTSLQRYLAFYREQLLDEQVLYPAQGRPTESFGEAQFGQHRLAWFLKKQKEATISDWESVLRETAEHPGYETVISSEGFEQLDAIGINAVRGLLSEHQVRVIFYFRHPADYMVSVYKQRVKSGKMHLRFDDFVKQQIHLCDYQGRVRRWRAVFGQDAIGVRVFEHALEVEGGLIADFLSQIRVKPDFFSRNDRQFRNNQSPSDAQIRVVRAINALEPRRNSIRLLSRLRAQVLSNRGHGKRLVNALKNRLAGLCSEAQRKVIEDYFTAHNASFLDEFSPGWFARENDSIVLRVAS